MAALEANRPAPPDAAVRQQVVARLPSAGEVKRLSPGQQMKLDSLAPILRVHRREGVYLLKVVQSPSPRLAVASGFVVLISDSALNILVAEELQGALAHEIGHEYVSAEYDAAVQAHNRRKRHELELVCDGIAAATLARVGLDPSVWSQALYQMYARRQPDLSYADDDYPSFDDRRWFVREIAVWLRKGSGRATGSGLSNVAGGS